MVMQFRRLSLSALLSALCLLGAGGLLGVSGAGATALISPKGLVLEAAQASKSHMIKGDFNADGRQDEAYFQAEGEGQEARLALHIRTDQGSELKDYRVTSVSIHDRFDLRLSQGETFHIDCGNFGGNCGQETLRTTQDGLVLSLNGHMEVLVHWTDQGFEQDFVTSEEGQLRRTLSALYALNP